MVLNVHEEPMCNHCDKQLCKTRKFGIGTQAYCFHSYRKIYKL